jgi:hypothetical protein
MNPRDGLDVLEKAAEATYFGPAGIRPSYCLAHGLVTVLTVLFRPSLNPYPANVEKSVSL